MQLEIGQLVRSLRNQGPLMGGSIGEFKGMGDNDFFKIEFIYGTFILQRKDFCLYKYKNHIEKVNSKLLMPDGFELNQGDVVSLVDHDEKICVVDAKNGRRYYLMPHELHKSELSALEKQEGGNHYKDLSIQPIEYIHANNIPFAEGSIIKYVTRWRAKNGIKDLEKARHFIDLLIELEGKK